MDLGNKLHYYMLLQPDTEMQVIRENLSDRAHLALLRQESLWGAEGGELKCVNFRIKAAWVCIPDAGAGCVISISHVSLQRLVCDTGLVKQ